MIAYLVYQCGLANVFIVDTHGKLRRKMQGAYSECEAYAMGLRDAGASLAIWHCDKAGDVKLWHKTGWEVGKGNLWADKKRPPNPRSAPIL